MNIPPTGLTTNDTISARAATKPPQTGPKRAAVINTGINLSDTFIPLPMRNVAYIPKRTVIAIISASAQRSLAECILNESFTLHTQHSIDKKIVIRNTLKNSERS